MLFQYEGTFLFDNVTADLPRGQVIAHGVAIFDRDFNQLTTQTLAIVGGTDDYEGARGQVSQSDPDGTIRTLTIRLSPP